MSPPHVSLLGVGILGHAIAARLLARGVQLTVWNRTAAKLGDLAAAGAVIAASPAEAARAGEVNALCLTDAAAITAVLSGSDGLLAGAARGGLVVDFSTAGVRQTRELAQLARESGLDWLDAPVSGGPEAAAEGRLAIFCGGEAAALARAQSLLDPLAAVVTHMGGVGCGQAAKLCNQLVVASNILAISEALGLAEALGLDPARLPRAMAGGFADSRPLQIFGPRMASGNLEPRISEVATMRKDVRIAMTAANDAGLHPRLGAAVAALYDLAVDRGLEHEDLGALIALAREARV